MPGKTPGYRKSGFSGAMPGNSLSHPTINGGDSSIRFRGAYGSKFNDCLTDLAINGEDCVRPMFNFEVLQTAIGVGGDGYRAGFQLGEKVKQNRSDA